MIMIMDDDRGVALLDGRGLGASRFTSREFLMYIQPTYAVDVMAV